MPDENDNFELYTQLIAKIVETKLAYIISKNLSLEFLAKEDSLVQDDVIKTDESALMIVTPLNQLESFLLLRSNLSQIPSISDIFSGGEGELDEGQELTDSNKKIFIDTISQTVTSVLKYFMLKDESLDFNFVDSYVIDLVANEETKLDLEFQEKYTSLKFKLVIEENFEIEFTLDLNEEHYNKLLESLQNIFKEFDMAEIPEMISEELNSLKAHTSFKSKTVDQDTREETSYIVNEKRNLGFLADVNLDLMVELGRVDMEFSKVLRITKGSAIELDRSCSEPVDLYVHNQLVARGEVVAIDDNFGFKVTEVLGSINLFKDLGLSASK
jgi:flagellar motor switch protein FliN